MYFIEAISWTTPTTQGNEKKLLQKNSYVSPIIEGFNKVKQTRNTVPGFITEVAISLGKNPWKLQTNANRGEENIT